MGKFTAFKLPLKSLAVGEHSFEYRLDKQFFANMENTDVRDAALTVDLAVKYDGEYYALDFAVDGTVTVGCDRCLDDLELPVEAGYSIAVRYGDDYNDDSDELLEIPASDDSLNVAYMIYDTVVTALPIKHVHPLGKCNRAMSAILKKHRATAPGEEGDLEETLIEEIDNIDADSARDPRWDALGKLAAGDSEDK